MRRARLTDCAPPHRSVGVVTVGTYRNNGTSLLVECNTGVFSPCCAFRGGSRARSRRPHRSYRASEEGVCRVCPQHGLEAGLAGRVSAHNGNRTLWECKTSGLGGGWRAERKHERARTCLALFRALRFELTILHDPLVLAFEVPLISWTGAGFVLWQVWQRFSACGDCWPFTRVLARDLWLVQPVKMSAQLLSRQIPAISCRSSRPVRPVARMGGSGLLGSLLSRKKPKQREELKSEVRLLAGRYCLR